MRRFLYDFIIFFYLFVLLFENAIAFEKVILKFSSITLIYYLSCIILCINFSILNLIRPNPNTMSHSLKPFTLICFTSILPKPFSSSINPSFLVLPNKYISVAKLFISLTMSLIFLKESFKNSTG